MRTPTTQTHRTGEDTRLCLEVSTVEDGHKGGSDEQQEGPTEDKGEEA